LDYSGVVPPTAPVELPTGRQVVLPGRGTTFVRELPGPPGAPTVVLLHGWLATADLNWFTAYESLGRRFRVLGMDHRGHGRGIRARQRFRLTDCAGDTAALIETLGAAPAIVVGYSMGGPVAQLTWRDHPGAVAGLVLCATAATFPTRTPVRILISSIALGVAMSPRRLRRQLLAAALARGVATGDHRDWLLEELGRHRFGDLVEAGRELGRFDARPWLGSVDVPATVMVTADDDVVPVSWQRELAALIPGATVRDVPGDHLAVVGHAETFVPELVEACDGVARRGRRLAA
jgi:pimeloyl-ACP methyl ester carboxylesterase